MTDPGFSRVSLWMATRSVPHSSAVADVPPQWLIVPAALHFWPQACPVFLHGQWCHHASSHTVWMAFSVSPTLSWIAACSRLLLRQILLMSRMPIANTVMNPINNGIQNGLVPALVLRMLPHGSGSVPCDSSPCTGDAVASSSND